MQSGSQSTPSPSVSLYAAALTAVVKGLAFIAGLNILVMIGITCADVVLRAFGHPIVGTYDIVRIAGALSVACALPYTTAVKGHVAIEYFVLKLRHRGRIIANGVVQVLSMGLFALLSWQSFRYGLVLQRKGEVTLTLQIPIFWLPYVIGLSCAVVVLVILYSVVHPRKELVKP